MVKVRLKFSKYGPIRFVGHLDVMRYFQKVMRRAGVDIAYSEGYSPHQLMSFAQPLSVGATSDGEYMDVVLHSACDDIIDRLNAVCHEGITITDAQVLPEKAEKAMTAVAACAWKVAYRPEVLREIKVSEDNGLRESTPLQDGNPGEANVHMQDALRDFLAQPRIIAHKKSKKGLTEIDIKPMIYRATLADDGTFDLLLKSGSEDNVKPALFLGVFLRFMYRNTCGDSRQDNGLSSGMENLCLQGDELKPECLKLHRTEIYRMAEGENGSVPVPLI